MPQVFPGSIYIFLLYWNVVAVGRFDCNCVCVLPVEIRNSTVVESVVILSYYPLQKKDRQSPKKG